jgi:hypothetical protein
MQASSVSNSSGTTALWDSNGGLYKSASSRRYKENLSPMNVSVEAIDAFLDVEPQFWDYKPQEGSEADAITGLAGFIAEDLATLDVISEGKCVLVNYANIAGVGEPDNFVPDSNRESALFAMLQQAIKKQRDAIKLLEARIEQLEVI